MKKFFKIVINFQELRCKDNSGSECIVGIVAYDKECSRLLGQEASLFKTDEDARKGVIGTVVSFSIKKYKIPVSLPFRCLELF
jgi:hypothetical protein